MEYAKKRLLFSQSPSTQRSLGIPSRTVADEALKLDVAAVPMLPASLLSECPTMCEFTCEAGASLAASLLTLLQESLH